VSGVLLTDHRYTVPPSLSLPTASRPAPSFLGVLPYPFPARALRSCDQRTRATMCEALGACCSRRCARAFLLCTKQLHRMLCYAGLCKLSWENATMHCIVVVYGVATSPSAVGGESY
jgi:hypothetical protein